MHGLVRLVAIKPNFLSGCPLSSSFKLRQGNVVIMKKSYMLHPKAVQRNWWIVDAKDQVLGRLCTEVATLLKGKHKPTYTPHVENGDHVVIINADKIVLTGNKWNTKMHFHSTGAPGGFTAKPVLKLKTEKPARILEHAIRGMLPKTTLGEKMFHHVMIYAGESHPHSGQHPQPMKLKGA